MGSVAFMAPAALAVSGTDVWWDGGWWTAFWFVCSIITLGVLLAAAIWAISRRVDGRGDMTEQPQRLYRSGTDRILAGVLGGLGNYFRLDASVVRIAYIIVTFFTGCIPGILLYVVMALIVPIEPQAVTSEQASPERQTA